MVFLGCDHGGLHLKEAVQELLNKRGIDFKDCGTFNGDSVDYPDFGEKVARGVSTGAADKGLLFCGTGIGMSIVANKFPHVRAALVGPSLSIPLVDGQMTLGTWQQIVLLDFDNKPRRRRVLVQIIGTS